MGIQLSLFYRHKRSTRKVMRSSIISAWLVLLSATACMSQDNDRFSLQFAIDQDDVNSLKQLLDKGVNAKAARWNGETTLMYAVGSGKDKMVEILLPFSDAKASTDEGNTALIFAVEFGTDKMVELLIPVSNVKASDMKGTTALMKASFRGTDKMVELLIPVSDVKASDKKGTTALMKAAFRGTDKMVEH